MSDDQAPATDLETAVNQFVTSDRARFRLPGSGTTYLVIPESDVRWLGWQIDPARPTPAPYVSIYPGMKGGSPTLNRTRLTVAAVTDWVWAGYDAEQTMRDWGITRADALVCCWYMAQYGGRRWRQRWGAWADRVYGLLARGEEAPWPPTEKTGAEQ